MPAKKKKPARKRRAKPAARVLDADDPHWIRGIEDYCDRWCERCDFSHRCLRFAVMEQLHDEKAAGGRRVVQNVYTALHRLMREAKFALEENARAVATSGDERRLAAHMAVEKRIHKRALASGLRETKKAFTYAIMVDEWFNNEAGTPLEHIRTLETQVRKGLIRVGSAKGDLVRINEAIEVIRWNQHVPYVKLCRAFTSRIDEEIAGGRPRRRDSDGSAKVALLAIDHSIAAWAQFTELFPERTDVFLDLLAFLSRLRRSIERRFPNARKFKRPGFDEKLRRRAK